MTPLFPFLSRKNDKPQPTSEQLDKVTADIFDKLPTDLQEKIRQAVSHLTPSQVADSKPLPSNPTTPTSGDTPQPAKESTLPKLFGGPTRS